MIIVSLAGGARVGQRNVYVRRTSGTSREIQRTKAISRSKHSTFQVRTALKLITIADSGMLYPARLCLI